MARILVIEDEELVSYTVNRILSRAGHEVVVAENGKEGLIKQAEAPFDLVITDILMPEKDGIDTIIELREKYPAIKIIAMSGGGRIGASDYLELAQQFEANECIEKPFSDEELMLIVNAVLESVS